MTVAGVTKSGVIGLPGITGMESDGDGTLKVAVSTGDQVPPLVLIVIMGASTKPEVGSVAVTVIITVPPFTGSGVATAANVGGVVSAWNCDVALPGLPARSFTVARTLAMPSGVACGVAACGTS